jgi:hypothetical protein
MARGLYSFYVLIIIRRRTKVLRVAFLLPLFFSGLREASPPAQYALAFIRFSQIIPP